MRILVMRTLVMRTLATVAITVLTSSWSSTGAAATPSWVEGRHYARIVPAQATTVAPGKVEVTEVLSYGCPGCNSFLPMAEQIKAQLPPQAQMVYMHASFNKAESWPMFQRAFYTAQALGLLDKTHEAMFGAVWGRGELAVVDASGRIKKPAPTIEDAAKWYAKKTGIDAKQFVAASAGFGVDSNIRRAEAWMRAARIGSTPTIVVNGKYRIEPNTIGNLNDLIALIDWLVKQELTATAAAR